MKLSAKDALGILGLSNQTTFDEIKLAYRRASAQYHPDKNPAGLEMMKLVNAAWQSLQNYVPSESLDDSENLNLGDEMNAALNAIIHLGLTIEICGSWIWVSGDTRTHKEALKLAGYKWASKKMLWHFRPSDYKSYSRGKFSMDDIRNKHGSVNVKSKSFTQIAA